MLSAPAANAAANKIGICHAPATLSNPYTYNTVDGSSTDESSAHYDHAEHPAYTWGPDGAWWNGEWHAPNSARPDLIPGKTLPAGTVVTRRFCNAVANIGPKSVTPSVTWTDPGCSNDNTPSWRGESVEGVSYALTAGEVAPDKSATVTATLQPGYVLAAGALAIFENKFGPVVDCTGKVAPQVPFVSQPKCTGPGTSSDFVVTLPTGPAGVSYGRIAGFVTATVTASDTVFSASLPGDWERVSDSFARFPVEEKTAGECLVEITADAPSATDNTCQTDGHLLLPLDVDSAYQWTGDTTDAPGMHTVTAVADAGYTLTGQVTWTLTVPAAGSGLDCPTSAKEVTPLEPTWVEAKCASDPRVDYTAVQGVSYATTGTVAPGQTVTVTASPLKNYKLKSGVASSWGHTFKAKPSGAACGNGDGDPVVPNPEPAPTEVTPNYPSATEADCSHRGFLVVPPQPAGVLMTRSGSVPGDVTFTFAPADGYVFPADAKTSVTVTVDKKLSGEDCILGEETTKPQPHGTKSPKPRDRAPIVLGTQAAVPTAVDAGLAGLPSASVSPISSPRLAQALVAGGLLLLIAGGSMGLGRRTRGAHES